MVVFMFECGTSKVVARIGTWASLATEMSNAVDIMKAIESDLHGSTLPVSTV